MKNILLLYFLVQSLIFAGSFGYLAYSNIKYNPPSENTVHSLVNIVTFPSLMIKEPKLFDIDPSSVSDVNYHGWIPTWAMDAGIKTLEERKDKFASVSPVFYSIQNDGSLQSNKNGLERLKALINGSKIKLIPTISSFDPNGLSRNLNNFESYNKYLLKEIDQHNFDGIDLNYELIYRSDKDVFFDHIKYLSSELKKRNKLLSVTVLSKWGDNIKYGFAPQTREVQDYKEIGKYADQIRIMTYDFTSQGSLMPGPIAPIEWVDQVLRYATNRVNPSKILLGIHLYGYFWSLNENGAKALDFRQATEIIKFNNSADKFYSEKYKEGALKFAGFDGKTYFGYFANPESVSARIDIAKKYGVNSVVFWRLGDDPL